MTLQRLRMSYAYTSKKVIRPDSLLRTGARGRRKMYRDPHALAPGDRDFDIYFKRDGATHRWSKIWNDAPGVRLHPLRTSTARL